MKDTFEKFSPLTVGFHWIIAIGMIAMLAFGLYIEDLPRGPDKFSLLDLHKSFGIVIFVLATARIFWRIKNKFPKPLSEMPSWQEFSAKFAHWFLIIATVMMPISGVMMSAGGGHPISFFGLELIAAGDKNEIIGNIGHIIHGLGSKVLIFFILLHSLGAIKHQYMDKDGTISRMAGKRVKTNTENV